MAENNEKAVTRGRMNEKRVKKEEEEGEGETDRE